MTTATAHEETPTHPVAARLKAAGIVKVAIIDDVFDPLRRDDMKSEISDFWNAIERDADRVAELRTVAAEVADKDDITDDVLGKLWESRSKLPKLAKPLADQLFAKRIIDLAPLEELVQHLKEAGVEPVRLGSEDPLPESFKLVFLDWLLGPGPGTSASQIAEERHESSTRSMRRLRTNHSSSSCRRSRPRRPRQKITFEGLHRSWADCSGSSRRTSLQIGRNSSCT